MLRRLLNIFLLVVAILSVFIILISPSLLFAGSFANSLKLSLSRQKISSKSLFIHSWRTIKNQYFDSSMNNQDWNRWKVRYIKKIKNDDDVVVAVNTMLASLNDEYSEFFNPAKFSKQNTLITESTPPFKLPKIQLYKKPMIAVQAPSVKILLTTIAGVVTKAEVVQDSKLCNDIKINDEVVRIDGYPLFGLDVHSAIKLISGKNITQRIDIVRDNKLRTVTLISGCLNTQKIDSRILPDNILLVNVYSLVGFNSPVNFIKCINHPYVKGIIVDLRGNVGGLFPNAIFIADMLIEKGLITTIQYRNNTKIDVTAQIQYDNEKIRNKPLVVLVDRRTASACEIFAGALKYNNRAVLVGMPTFGKNSVQNIVPLHNGMGMNLTFAKYLLGNSIDIGSKGIEPDYKVDITYKDILNKKDTQLEKAIEIINKATEN